MARVIGGPVRPHVQAFADAAGRIPGVAHISTYAGHDPTQDRALDIFVPVHDPGPGNAVCDYAIRHLEHYGVDYIIFRQRIYNPEVAPYWRRMADRGGVTQNHYDHVHISFEPTGSAQSPGPDPGPPPEPAPEPEPANKEDLMAAYTVVCPEGKTTAVPAPPAHGGGLPWEHVFVSFMSSHYETVRPRIVVINRDGHGRGAPNQAADEHVDVPPGRRYAIEFQQEDSGVVVINDTPHPLTALVEAKAAW